MILKRILFHVTALIILSSGNEAVTIGKHNTTCVYPIDADSPKATQNASYRFKPVHAGTTDETDESFEDRMKRIFTGDQGELLCPVQLSDVFHELPQITCPEIYPQELHDILRRLNTNYTDVKAQDDLLDYVWRSQVGSRMLNMLISVFENEDDAKAQVKEMWFYHDEAHEVMLFPDVFFGYELHKTEYGMNLLLHEKLHDNEALRLVNGITRKEFPYNAAPVSWTGIHFKKENSELRFTEGFSHPLVKNSLHLAAMDVSINGDKREAKLIVGTSFLYDFVAFTMCWIYRGRLGPCVTPLPGNTNQTVEFRSITIQSYAAGSTMDDIELQVHCVGFRIDEEVSKF